MKGGGGLEQYVGVTQRKPFIHLANVLEIMVAFRLPDVEGRARHVQHAIMAAEQRREGAGETFKSIMGLLGRVDVC
jgi:hypothetical protein